MDEQKQHVSIDEFNRGPLYHILSFSYDAPMSSSYKDDCRGLVFSLYRNERNQRYKVSLRAPKEGYDEECVYSFGSVAVQRAGVGVRKGRPDGEEIDSWLLPQSIEERITELLTEGCATIFLGFRDLDENCPIYFLTIYDRYNVSRKYRFNLNFAEGLSDLIELADLVRCGRGGLIDCPDSLGVID